MTTLTESRLSMAKASADESVDHLYCCDENVSLCGLDISEIPEMDILPDLCIVCDDLDMRACERCGE